MTWSCRVRLCRGFTLLELLVVMAIIGLLVGILLPVLGQARATARTALCLSQIRQISAGALLYAQDYRGQLPRSSHSALAFGVRTWSYVLPPYLGHEAYRDPPVPMWWANMFNGLYRCPSDARREMDRWSYGKNVYPELDSTETADPITSQPGPTWATVDTIPRPAATLLWGEIRVPFAVDHIMAHFWLTGGSPEVDRHRHGQVANYSYFDGHSQSLTFSATFTLSPLHDLWNPATAR